MKIDYQNSRFELTLASEQFQFLMDLKIASAAGFTFDALNKKWWTIDPIVVSNLKGKATISRAAATIYQSYVDRAAKVVAQSRAISSAVPILVPEGLDYLPYQKAGIVYAGEREATLIADEMGLGKTIQAIGVANANPLVHRVLIICPSSLKLNWEREWKKWDVKHLSVAVVKDRSAAKKRTLPSFFLSDVVIVNYERAIMDENLDQIHKIPWDLLIIDEAHYLKDSGAMRTKKILGFTRYKPIVARNRVFLSGTPMVNRPCELWTLSRTLDPKGLGANKDFFEFRYCAKFLMEWVDKASGKLRRVWNVTGSSNEAELQERLRSSFMIRRLKVDVLKELAPKIIQIIPLETTSTVRVLMKKEQVSYEEWEKIEGQEEKGVAFAELAKARIAVAREKLPICIEHIREALDENDKIVVFAHHHEILDELKKAFAPSAVCVDGRVSIENRQAAVDRFQNEADCKVFIGGIHAAGMGITLTAASLVVFVELDWTPGNVTQAEDRLHRIGQTKTVLVQHLIFEESLDERMVEILIDKKKVSKAVLDTEGGI